MSGPYDCIVVGGGHNGLVCAAFLAKAGKRVLVLEAADRVGGAARNIEVAPGFEVSACAHILHLLHPKVIKALKPKKHGLKLVARNMPTVALGPDGKHLILRERRIDGAVEEADRTAWPELQRRLRRMARALQPYLGRTPPRLGGESWRERMELARLGLSLRMLGKTEMREFLRIVNMNVFDLLDDDLVDARLKGALAFDAVLGTNFGPRSPGSVLSLLYRMAGDVQGSDGLAIPEGGMAAVSEALAASAKSFGADIRTGVPVRRILTDGDRAGGVELESGETVEAGVVISNADPKSTLLGLLGAEHLDTGFVRRVNAFRSKGLAAKLNLALDGLPQFTGLESVNMGGRLVIAPDMGYVERAFDHSKYGEYSAEPAIEITIPSLHDGGLAPPGKHVMSAIVQYAPRDLKEGWAGARDAFADLVVKTIAAYAPDLPQRIEARQLLTPEDLERDFRITGGHWHHGDLAVDQMLMLRPVPGYAKYETPVPGLYLCGAGAHPGGGVMGAAGMNAARRVLEKEAQS
jgi:phytoene dehydrogenase-like protein